MISLVIILFDLLSLSLSTQLAWLYLALCFLEKAKGAYSFNCLNKPISTGRRGGGNVEERICQGMTG